MVLLSRPAIRRLRGNQASRLLLGWFLSSSHHASHRLMTVHAGKGVVFSPMLTPLARTMTTTTSTTENTTSVPRNDTLETLQELVSRLEDSKRSVRIRPNAYAQAHASQSKQATLRELASTVCLNYRKLPPMRLSPTDISLRRDVISYLVVKCTPSETFVAETVANYTQNVKHEDPDPDMRLRVMNSLLRLHEAVSPQYEQVLQLLLEQNSAQGIPFLVSLREDLRQWIPSISTASSVSNSNDNDGHGNSHDDLDLVSKLKQLDSHLLQLLSTWFSPGMLEIRRITYETTPASIIETIAVREAVHPMKSLDDLRTRLGSGRRVFALFHPLLPAEPLVILHVSLQEEIPASMTPVLNTQKVVGVGAHEHPPPSVATFYSISSLQPGLAGVGLGEYLIKEAVQLLRQELPGVHTFVTLSPLPRFRRWLEERCINTSGKFASTDLIESKDLQKLAAHLDCPPEQVLSLLVARLKAQGPANISLNQDDSDGDAWMEPILVKLVARYLLREKHRRKPLDGVARFHVGNGAQVFRINWAADLSRKGWLNSFGVMVNYRYELETVQENQAKYEEDYHIPTGRHVLELLEEEE
jgi:malonyl-CoA decarboxylase